MNNNSAKCSLDEIKQFLKTAANLEFKSLSKEDRNEWVQTLLLNHHYKKCSRQERGILKKYIQKMTGLSRAQAARLISEFKKRATLKKDETKKSERNCFDKFYTREDIALLAKVDNAHDRLSGPATIKICSNEYYLFGKEDFYRLKNISSSHLYRLRSTPRYREKVKIFSKTKAVGVPIGERRKPEPNGKPGYLCVDTVHQGDKDGEKGVYHINIVDMVTQYEFVGAVRAITEIYMEKMLAELIEKFPYAIIEIHSDNGGEYINKIVVALLNKLLIKLTKSRPRHSNDNGLAETKNGAVIRKHMGYMHMPRNRADVVNDFYKNTFNDYLIYHRPCAFPKTKINAKGKEIKFYPKENYMTPYQKLKSIPNAEQYLKPGVTFEELDKIMLIMSDTEYAEFMQKEKTKLFKNI